MRSVGPAEIARLNERIDRLNASLSTREAHDLTIAAGLADVSQSNARLSSSCVTLSRQTESKIKESKSQLSRKNASSASQTESALEQLSAQLSADHAKYDQLFEDGEVLNQEIRHFWRTLELLQGRGGPGFHRG
jgi:chromosome segregation ATPase